MDPSLDMAPILAALRPELARGVRHIHIWDLHSMAEPRQIAFSPDFEKLIGAYGKPVYVVEDVSGSLKSLLEQLPGTTAAQLHDRFNTILATLPEPVRQEEMPYLPLFDRWFDGARIVTPDSRVGAFEQNSFTREEAVLYDQFLVAARGKSIDELPALFKSYRAALARGAAARVRQHARQNE